MLLDTADCDYTGTEHYLLLRSTENGCTQSSSVLKWWLYAQMLSHCSYCY